MEKILAAVRLVVASLIAHAFPGAHLPETHPLVVRTDAAAVVVARETADVYSDFSAKKQEARARAATVWLWYESGMQANPKGSNDDGSACGGMQVHPASFPAGTFPESMTCAAMRKDLATGVRAGLIAFRYFEDKCGSFRGALTAFSTNGTCPDPKWTIKLVARRCKDAGLNSACELP